MLCFITLAWHLRSGAPALRHILHRHSACQQNYARAAIIPGFFMTTAPMRQHCRSAPACGFQVHSRPTSEHRVKNQMKMLKIRLSGESEELLRSQRVSLDELGQSLVFGRRRRLGPGVEILFDALPPEYEKDVEIAEQLRHLRGLSGFGKAVWTLSASSFGPTL